MTVWGLAFFYVYYISKFWICQLILKIFLLYVRRRKLGKNRAGRRGFCRKRRSGGENELWFSRKSEGVMQSQLRRGRLCHTPKGGGCYEELHIKNFILYYSVFDNIYYKSKITPADRSNGVIWKIIKFFGMTVWGLTFFYIYYISKFWICQLILKIFLQV